MIPQISRVETLVRGKARFLQFLERRVGNRADAEDLLQIAFLRLVAHGNSLRDEDKLVPWFYQLLRNLIVDHYRHRGAMAQMERALANETAGSTEAEDPELFKAVCACVNDALAVLKSGQAEVVRRVELESMPVSQVAVALGITAGNASVRLHRARRALREALQAMCGVCTEHGCLDCSCHGKGRP